MRRHAVIIGLAFLAMAGFALLLGWVFYKASTPVAGARTLGPLWPYLLGGALIGAALVGFLTWLAAYATLHHQEDRP
jgi:hypothetical protein